MQRIRFFDIAKGIAILAVILGHSAIETNLFVPHRTAQIVLSICFSFHMPLFFILSGYFMHPERRFRWMKEAKQLLFTYVVTALCVLVGVTCMATFDHESRAIALRQWGMAAIYGSGDISNLTLWRVDLRIGAIWFLLALFWEPSVVALPRKASLHPCLGGAVFCCRLCFRTVRTAAVEHPSGNVRGSIPLLGVSCQEMRSTWRCETFPLRVGYCVYYLGGRHHVFRWHEHGRQ